MNMEIPARHELIKVTEPIVSLMPLRGKSQKRKTKSAKRGKKRPVEALAVVTDEQFESQLAKIETHHRLSQRSLAVSFSHQAICGEELSQIQAALGRGRFGEWVGIYLPHVHRRTVQRWQKAAKLWPTFCKEVAKQAGVNATSVSHLSPEEVLAILGEEESGKILQILDVPNKVEPIDFQANWLTPQSVLQQVHNLLGWIDLDPCANKDATNHVPANHHYTAHGLKQPWEGRVFVNPGASETLGEWAKRAVEEVKAGNAEEVVLLLPALTDAAWVAQLQPYPRAFLYECTVVSVPGAKSLFKLPYPLMLMFVSRTNRTTEFADHVGVIGDVFVPFRIG